VPLLVLATAKGLAARSSKRLALSVVSYLRMSNISVIDEGEINSVGLDSRHLSAEETSTTQLCHSLRSPHISQPPDSLAHKSIDEQSSSLSSTHAYRSLILMLIEALDLD
jgi:hypothetical protein